MTTANYAERFATAMSAVDPQESADKIKNAVMDEIHDLDPRVHLTKTEYFNHTYAPDLVASWRDENEEFERYIYIRPDTNASHLLEDIQFIQDNKPIVFGLSFDDWIQQLPNLTELANASRESNTLVTDISGVAGLIENQTSRFLKMVSSSLTKGGRGLIDEIRAHTTSNVLKQGFDGALSLQRESTEDAINVLDSYLNEDHSRKAQQLLQAVWVGAGGGLTNFPGSSDLSGSISDDALYFLLTYDEIDDATFWRRLGKNLSLSQIGRIGLTDGSTNLDHLMKYNVDIFWTRCTRVQLYFDLREPTAGTSAKLEHKWFTRSRLVGIRQRRFDALFADKVDELERQSRGVNGIDVDDFKTRAADIVVDRVDLATGSKQVRYSSEEDTNILSDGSLETIANTLGDEALVRRADILLDGFHHVSCDFSTLTATGRTSSKFPLPDLARTCLPLLVNLSEEERVELNETFEDPADGLTPPSRTNADSSGNP